MDFLGWVAVVGGLLLIMALSTALLRRLPITTSLIYLGCGIAIGPLGLAWLNVDLITQAALFERLAEVAVVISLFVGGLKLRLSPREPEWRAAFILAGPVMLVSIAAVGLFAHFVFGTPPAFALLLGAILAPTDPVLASSVSVNDASDRDRLRYALSAEAGLNDGAAFPFVILALLWMSSGTIGPWVGSWAVSRILWAVPAGLLIGYTLGYVAGRFTIHIRSRHHDADAPNDFLALALIALTYALTESLHGWGFLAVFAAGVGVRSAEAAVVERSPHPEHERTRSTDDEPHPPAEALVSATVSEEEMRQPAVAAGVVLHEVLSFGRTIERLLEVMLVVLVGIVVSRHWDARALLLAGFLFVAVRPIASWLLLTSSGGSASTQRWLMGWFGIRGVGSIYYLAYSLNHAPVGRPEMLVSLVVSVVALSILVHGATAQPLLDHYERLLRRLTNHRSVPPPQER